MFIQPEDRFYETPQPTVQRTFWTTERVLVKEGNDYCRTTREQENRVQVPPAEAQLTSSLLRDGQHAPALDLDFPCRLVPSSTPGHFHLYIDKPMSWRKYKKLMKALVKAGLLEKGYYRASVAREGSDLRMPGVSKVETPLPSGSGYSR
jgi:hypothetical protein